MKRIITTFLCLLFAFAVIGCQPIEKGEKWIVVTGWTPHWKFAEWDLKFLDDPKGVFGDVETIEAYAREGFTNDEPEIAQFFGNFSFSTEELGSLMDAVREAEDNQSRLAAVRSWADENGALIDGWLEDIDTNIESGNINFVYVNWAEGIAMTYLAATIMEDEFGYTFDMNQVDVGPVFASLNQKDADIFLDTWLPVTHQSYIEEYPELESLGTIFDNAKIGLVVPSYVTINSIEELNEHKDKFEGKIVGIDAGAGIMAKASEAVEVYGLDFNLITSSGPAMTAALSDAIGG